ncbi:MAG: exodeoxyribonuclease VII small subunit [Candidatus Mycalebacterium zealandia]|nr:MAG: exodeoxyribonuclease VII small subunit [Candidatus Mycalebacterium zealandia]
MSFEKKLKKIQDISDSLESRDIPLEKMIQNFETGIKLIKECRELLEETEKKIETLGEEKPGRKRSS